MEHSDNETQPILDTSQQAGWSHGSESVDAPDSLLPNFLDRLGLGNASFSLGTSVDQLQVALDSQEWTRRVAAARALGKLGERMPLELLEKALKDTNEFVRAVAVQSLGRLRERAPIEPLVAALSDPDWQVREAAVLALGELGRQVQNKISDALGDADLLVHKAAEQVLQQLYPDVLSNTHSNVAAPQLGRESGRMFDPRTQKRLEFPEQDGSDSRYGTYKSEPKELDASAAHLRQAVQTFSRCKHVAPDAFRSFGHAVNAAFAVLVVMVLIVLALFLFRHHPTTTTGGANATATALATAINRASTPQDIYTVLTSSSPVLNDPLSSQDANRWDKYATTKGGCKFTGGAYHSYVLQPYVAECYARSKSFPQTTIFALQVQVMLIKGDGGGGLIFGYRGGNLRYYRFVVRSDGYFDLYDPWTQRQLPYGTNSAFKANPGQSIQLTVIVRNSIIFLYINGTYIGQASMEADTSVSGEIGLFSVDGQHNPTEVVFHDMKVWVIR